MSFLSKENLRLRARIQELEAENKRLVAALDDECRAWCRAVAERPGPEFEKKVASATWNQERADELYPDSKLGKSSKADESVGLAAEEL